MFKPIDQGYHRAPKITIKFITELNAYSQDSVSRALSRSFLLQGLEEDSLLSCESFLSQQYYSFKESS